MGMPTSFAFRPTSAIRGPTSGPAHLCKRWLENSHKAWCHWRPDLPQAACGRSRWAVSASSPWRLLAERSRCRAEGSSSLFSPLWQRLRLFKAPAPTLTLGQGTGKGQSGGPKVRKGLGDGSGSPRRATDRRRGREREGGKRVGEGEKRRTGGHDPYRPHRYRQEVTTPMTLSVRRKWRNGGKADSPGRSCVEARRRQRAGPRARMVNAWRWPPRLYARLLAELLALVQSRRAELWALTPERQWPWSFWAELPNAKAGTAHLNLATYLGCAPSSSDGRTVLGVWTSTSSCSQRWSKPANSRFFFFIPAAAESLSRVRLCATQQTAAYQAPPSLGFSRQEHWVAIAFSDAGKWKVKMKSLSCVRLLATAWTAAPPGSSAPGVF